MPVEQQDVHARDLYVKYPQSISGTVRDADTGKPIAGAEIDSRLMRGDWPALIQGP